MFPGALHCDNTKGHADCVHITVKRTQVVLVSDILTVMMLRGVTGRHLSDVYHSLAPESEHTRCLLAFNQAPQFPLP